MIRVPKSEIDRFIAQRAARELAPGEIVNLGIGIPTLVADFVPADKDVFIQTENGMLGVGPAPEPGLADPYLVNAGKLPVTETIGSSYFSSADSFAMIRGGHIDTAILGVLQVDRLGRIANWAIPGKSILGVGGAMDLIVGAKRIIVVMTHTTKDGKPKIVNECQYPLSSTRQADLVITEHAVFQRGPNGLFLKERLSDISMDELARITGIDISEPEDNMNISIGERQA